MRRRDFLKALSAALIGAGVAPQVVAESLTRAAGESDAQLKEYLDKMRQFYKPHAGDVFVERERSGLLHAVVRRLSRLESTVGHGKFQLVEIDAALQIGRDYPQVGEFSKAESEYLETIFYADATRYGFLGEKLMQRMTDRIPAGEVVKVAGSGNYLDRGQPLQAYELIRREVGEQAVLTSGVRGIMKQFFLFLRKADENNGNLSLSSRSFAPPGFSFHGISDFDLGQTGFGADNFTERFVTSEGFRKLKDLGHINLRYPKDNLLGVRFEPWHIKVDARL